jgi:hypothetical protein
MCGPQPYYQPQPYAYNNGYGGYADQPQAGYYGQQHPQWSADEVNRRLQHQADRLQAGIASGQISPEEATRLQAEQSRIQAAMTRMQTDGNLNPRELARLNQMLNYSGRDIYRQSNNGTTVPPPTTATNGTGTNVTGTGTTVAGTGTGTGTGATATGTGTTVTPGSNPSVAQGGTRGTRGTRGSITQPGSSPMAQTGTTGTAMARPGTTAQTGTAGIGPMARPGTSPTIQPGSSPTAQQRPAGGSMYGQNPQMAGPQPNLNGPRVQQPNMAGPRVQQPNMAGPRVQQPNMAGPRVQQPNMAGPRVQPRPVQPAAAPRVAPNSGRRVAAVPGR